MEGREAWRRKETVHAVVQIVSTEAFYDVDNNIRTSGSADISVREGAAAVSFSTTAPPSTSPAPTTTGIASTTQPQCFTSTVTVYV